MAGGGRHPPVSCSARTGYRGRPAGWLASSPVLIVGGGWTVQGGLQSSSAVWTLAQSWPHYQCIAVLYCHNVRNSLDLPLNTRHYKDEDIQLARLLVITRMSRTDLWLPSRSPSIWCSSVSGTLSPSQYISLLLSHSLSFSPSHLLSISVSRFIKSFSFSVTQSVSLRLFQSFSL